MLSLLQYYLLLHGGDKSIYDAQSYLPGTLEMWERCRTSTSTIAVAVQHKNHNLPDESLKMKEKGDYKHYVQFVLRTGMLFESMNLRSCFLLNSTNFCEREVFNQV